MNGWSVFLSLTQTAEIAIFTFPGILCLAECFFLAEYLLQESVQPFAKLVFEESEVVDRYLGLSWRSHFDDRGVAFGSCPVDVEQGRGYLQRLLAAEDGGVQKRLENIVGTVVGGSKQLFYIFRSLGSTACLVVHDT